MHEPPWLDADEMRAWRSFIETVGDLIAALDADLQEAGALGLGDYQVLVYLSEAEGWSLRMCDLAARLHLSPSGLTRRIDGLVRRGFVVREPCESDRRVLLARLTEPGHAALAEAAPHHVESIRRHLLTPLSRAQVCALGEIFSRVGTALAPPPS
ncbi:MAG: MarR family transcriptional regulator [Caldilineae bacterium]|nr:MarR family transcriptional regulator [Chloroflexota bacterium]MCB9176940.1 MarR family transcriptional regulator [Caldilineae bacterium]